MFILRLPPPISYIYIFIPIFPQDYPLTFWLQSDLGYIPHFRLQPEKHSNSLRQETNGKLSSLD